MAIFVSMLTYLIPISACMYAFGAILILASFDAYNRPILFHRWIVSAQHIVY